MPVSVPGLQEASAGSANKETGVGQECQRHGCDLRLVMMRRDGKCEIYHSRLPVKFPG